MKGDMLKTTFGQKIKGGSSVYLEVRDIRKSYGEGGGYIEVLKGISTSVEEGQMPSLIHI